MARPARLTSALLARKGHALPTGGFAHSRLGLVPPQPSAANRETKRSGGSRSRPGLSSDLIRPAAAKPNRAPERARADRIAFTVRLDHKRHARLKSLAARDGGSAQEILIKALDAYFEACAPDRACLPRPARRRNR